MKNRNEKKEFCKTLKKLGYKFQVRKTGKIIIIKSNGYVYLESLTTMPDNVQFNNHGFVYLRSLTTMPDNVQFNNHGYVDLRSLTTMPDNVQFNNHGSVYLESLTTEWNGFKIKTFDGYSMKVLKEKTIKGFKIYICDYLGMNEIDNKECFVAEKGRFTAHGKDVKSAIEDVNFKFMQEELDVSSLVSEIKERGVISVNEYRLLTGACLTGCNNFLESKGITKRELTIKEALDLTNGSYGSEKLIELFN